MDNEKLKRSNLIINFTLGTLWGIGLGIGMALSYQIYKKTQWKLEKIDEVSSLLSAFAILISAGIASVSVMKNIAETKAHDIAKSEKEKERKYVFALTTMQAIHSTISSLREYQSPEPVSILHLNFMANMETVQKLIDSIFSESILTHLPENEKNDISEFYISFNRYLFFKKLSSPNQNSPTDVNGFNDVVKQYKEQFGKYSKNYIEIYNINKDSQ